MPAVYFAAARRTRKPASASGAAPCEPLLLGGQAGRAKQRRVGRTLEDRWSCAGCGVGGPAPGRSIPAQRRVYAIGCGRRPGKFV